MHFEDEAKKYTDPDAMASAYLKKYYNDREIEYPINPFQILKDEGILFSLMNFKKLEGVYVPATSESDIAVVGINVNRPITRQRFTAAHELCHHLRDADKQVLCPIGGKNAEEKFAEQFAAALLMPITDLKKQVDLRRKNSRYVSFDDVLDIAGFFGVSFESCLFRIAYRIHAIAGNTEVSVLKKAVKKYGPEKVRKSRHMTNTKLYEGLMDCYQEQLTFQPSEFARYLFQNNYIYNDSRLEGIDITHDQVAEIVADLRLKTQNSEYCIEDNEAFLSIAGHYDMYQDIFSEPVKETISVYDTLLLNRKLFSYYPCPEYGGSIRQCNVLVQGAKFETIDYHDIYPELTKLDTIVRDYFLRRYELSKSEYVKHVVRTHHRITVIHPFPDGNGRTSRAFMNVQLVRAGIVPVYIKADDKPAYFDALARADALKDYDELYEIVFRLIFRSYADLISRED